MKHPPISKNIRGRSNPPVAAPRPYLSQQPWAGFTQHDRAREQPLPVCPSPRCRRAKACLAAHDTLYCRRTHFSPAKIKKLWAEANWGGRWRRCRWQNTMTLRAARNASSGGGKSATRTTKRWWRAGKQANLTSSMGPTSPRACCSSRRPKPMWKGPQTQGRKALDKGGQGTYRRRSWPCIAGPYVLHRAGA